MGEQQFKRYKSPILGLVLGMVIGLAVAIGLGSILPWRPVVHKVEVAAAGDLPHQLFKAPGYSDFRNQLGQSVSSKEFAGKVQLVTFMWPGCTYACPILASRMVNLEVLLRKRGLDKKVSLLTFNVDPEESGPTQTKQFMEQYGADTSNGQWQFLSGTQKSVSVVVKQGFHANYEKIPASELQNNLAPQDPNNPYRYMPRMMNSLASGKKQSYEIVSNTSAVIVGPKGEVLYVLPKAYMVSEAAMLNDIIRALHTDKGI